MMKNHILMLIFTALLFSAHAHKVKIFATVENDKISGYGYFAGGGAPINTPVTVYAPDKSKLGETVTDENGEFTFTPTKRVDHTFIIQTPDGHRAEYTIKAQELQSSLKGTSDAITEKPAVSEMLPQSISLQLQTGSTRDIEEAVRRQINPLREQIEHYEERIRLHDILGGIGYIFGITGIAFYLLAKRHNKRS